MEEAGSMTILSNAAAAASGMVAVQASCSLDDALALMRARAEATNCTLEQVAAGVIARDIRFGDAQIAQ